jgi:hypothetical protein
LGNNQSGVLIDNASLNQIGRNGSAPNVISGNLGNGVTITGASVGNRIVSNSIFSNAGLGIDLGNDGATANDISDGDTGPNNLQNFPAPLSVVPLVGGDLQITYVVDSVTENSAYPLRIEFFLADADNQEGQTLIGSDTYTEADQTPAKTITITPLVPVTSGDRVVATATDDNGNQNTSEFSASAVVNAAPMITSSATQSAAENQTAVATITATDPDLPAQTLTWTETGGADASMLSISTSGVLTFDTAPDFENPTDFDMDGVYVIDVQVSDGAGGEASQTVMVTVTDVNDSPIAMDFTGVKAFDTFANVGLEVGGAVFASKLAALTDARTLKDGATDVDSLPANFAVTAETKTTSLGGSVTINADGSFVYTPQAGDTGIDTFTYTLTDGDGASDTGNVEIKLDSDTIVWFIDDSADAWGDGTSISPFDSLSDVTGAAGPDAAGETLFLASGNYDGEIVLLQTQTLFGQGIALTLDLGAGNAATTIVSASTNPVITATNTAVTLDSGNSLKGFTVGDSRIDIAGSTFGNLLVNGVTLTGTGTTLVLYDGSFVAGSVFNSIESTSTFRMDGLSLYAVGGSVSFGSTTMSNSATDAIKIENSTADIDFGNTTIGTSSPGSGAGSDGAEGIRLQSNASGSFTFGTLSIQNTFGEGIHLLGSGANLTVLGAATISNTGAGVRVENSSSNVSFQSLSISEIPFAGGIALTDHSGSFTTTGGTITTTNGDDVKIMGGNGTVTIAQNITNTMGRSVVVQSRTGGTVAFSGMIDDDADGIFLDSNGAGTINFSGGMALDTGSKTGFNATGGGTVNVTGTNTIGATTALSKTAVNIVGVNIGTSGVTFHSIWVTGSFTSADTSAIILSNTGSGNFTVTGDGTAASGGQGGNASGGYIVNITDIDAIRLYNVDGIVSLNCMVILNTAHTNDNTAAKKTVSGVDAIQGTGTIGGLALIGTIISNTSDMAVNGSSSMWGSLTIDNSVLDYSNRYGVAGKGDDINEGMVVIYGISGNASVTNSKFDQGATLLDLQTPTTGNLNLTATNNSFNNSYKGFDNAADGIWFVGGNAVRVRTQGSATATVILGAQDQATSSLGNSFLNDYYSVHVGHTNETDSGLIKATLSYNNFQVTDHLRPTGDPTLYSDFPQGSVLIQSLGDGGLNANVSHNTFDQLTDSEVLPGSLSVAAENGTTQVKIHHNTFINPWNFSMELRADNNAILTAEVNNNSYVSSAVGGAGTDDPGFTGPYGPISIKTMGNAMETATINLTMHDEAIPANFSQANDLLFSTSSPSQTINTYLHDLTAPKGYRFSAAISSTINVFRNGSTETAINEILSDNLVKGGSGASTTDPPTVAITGTGTVQGTDTAPTLPSFIVP